MQTINYTKGYYKGTKFDAHVKDFIGFGDTIIVHTYLGNPYIVYWETKRRENWAKDISSLASKNDVKGRQAWLKIQKER